MKKIVVLFFLAFVFINPGYSQDPENSIYSVPEKDKLYSVTVWRRIFMDEKQNQAFFSRNRELSRVLIDAVRDGLIVPYQSDSLARRLSKEEFENRLIIKTGADEDSWGGSGWNESNGENKEQQKEEDPWAAADPWGGAEAVAAATFDRDPSEINILEIKEEVFFDKIRSRMYNAIEALTLYYLDQNTGIREPVASFDYKEAEKVFRANPDKAVWYNRQNPGQNRNMADAFLLRLFHGMIVKISNPRNLTLREQVPDPQLALYLSMENEYKLAEYESDLWEY
jgi:gliding motility associated protien GldN